MRSLMQEVDHGGGAFGMIPDANAHSEGGLVWCLRHAPDSNNAAMQAATVITTFDYLLGDEIDMTEATKRLRQMRRERRNRKYT